MNLVETFIPPMFVSRFAGSTGGDTDEKNERTMKRFIALFNIQDEHQWFAFDATGLRDARRIAKKEISKRGDALVKSGARSVYATLVHVDFGDTVYKHLKG